MCCVFHGWQFDKTRMPHSSEAFTSGWWSSKVKIWRSLRGSSHTSHIYDYGFIKEMQKPRWKFGTLKHQLTLTFQPQWTVVILPTFQLCKIHIGNAWLFGVRFATGPWSQKCLEVCEFLTLSDFFPFNLRKTLTQFPTLRNPKAAPQYNNHSLVPSKP